MSRPSDRPAPPAPARWLARRALPGAVRASVLGDLDERFASLVQDAPIKARLWYWRQALSLASHYRGRTAAGAGPTEGGGGTGGGWRGLLVDARQATRSSIRSPAASAFVIVTLALGIGALLATVTAVRDTLDPPPVFRAEDRTLAIWPAEAFSRGQLQSMREDSSLFEVIGGTVEGAMTLRSDGTLRTVNTAFVSPGLLSSLASPPLAGTLPGPEHEAPGEPLALLGESLWRNAFDADPDVVGTRIELDGVSRRVMGVLPEQGTFPRPGMDVILPLQLDPRDEDFWPLRELSLVGRVRPGVDLEAAQQDVVDAIQTLVARYPSFFSADFGLDATVRPVGQLLYEAPRARALLLLGAVAAVLIAVCANLGSLLLSRNLGRRVELGTRAALGAGKGRLGRQLMLEHAVLGLSGGLLGAALTLPLGSALAWLLPETADAPAPSPWLAAGGVALALLASLAAGLPSLTDLLRREPTDDLTGEPGVARVGGQRAQSVLVAIQIGLACTLIAGTAMLGRSIAHLQSRDTGMDLEGVTALRLETPEGVTATELGLALAATLEQLRASGTAQAGASATTPYDQPLDRWPINPADAPVSVGEAIQAGEQVMTPGTLELLGVELVAGRRLEPGDDGSAPAVVVVNRTLADRLWPGEPPERAVGRRIAVDPHAWDVWLTVVGVVEDTRPLTLAAPYPALFYRPWSQAPRSSATLLARSSTDVTALASTVRATATELTLAWARPLQELAARQWSRAASTGRLFSTLAGAATLLVMLGVYGVVWTSVRRRTRELAVRKALGATATDAAGLVVRFAAGLTLGGLAVGAAGVAWLGGFLDAILTGVSPLDPASLVLAAVATAITVAAAAAVPARWAARLAPAEAMREGE